MALLPHDRQAWLRLLAACCISLALHAWLILAVPVRAPDAAPGASTPLIARLEAVPAEETRLLTTSEPTPGEQASVAAPPAAASGRARREHVQERAAPPPMQYPPAAALAAPAAPDETYYPVARLDRLPQELSRLKPVFPERAHASGMRAGEVTLMVMIDENGAVDDASVIEAKPPGYFEESALAWAAQQARFSAAQRSGRNVRSRVLIRLNYSADAP
jgi:protein TonB